MRFVPAFAGALLITTAVFLFMQILIESRQRADVQQIFQEPIEILRETKTHKEPEPTPEEHRQEPEPEMEALRPPVAAPQPDVKLEVPAMALDMGDLNIKTAGNKWSAPMGEGDIGLLEGSGRGAEGYVEVVPYSTRKPNVPELAWKNKVNGWVLVAFNVRADGSTANIRVLDASPRGVFEEKVIAAVEDWAYSVRYYGELKGDVVLTQRVEVEWKDFHMNVPYLDEELPDKD